MRWPCSNPGRDDDLTFRLGLDPGIATMVNLANASWPLGEVDRAILHIERAQCRSAEFTFMPSCSPLRECIRLCSI